MEQLMKFRTIASILMYCLVRLPVWFSVPYLWWHAVLDVVAVLFIMFSSELSN